MTQYPSVFADLPPPTYAENPSGLWASIEKFEFDLPDVELPFSARLARDNGWSSDFAHRVIDEYRRFLYLSAVAGHTVSPSDEVDQVWHLHLTYTSSYWYDLCEGVLGWPLHHGPTQGGEAEQKTYTNLYEATLESYERIFGVEPPTDIWPPSEQRFGDAPNFERLNRKRHWVIKKPSWWGTNTNAATAGWIGCGGGCGGCGGGCGGCGG